MMLRLQRDNFQKIFRAVYSRLSQKSGNILVYIVMIMVIFALLGAVMVSLFSTSISSSATANESRRAFYLSESGIRYGLSELRQKGFTTSNITTLNNTIYKMPPSGDFAITVFGSWFKSPSNQSVASGALSVEIDKGKIPQTFFEKTLTDSAVVANLYLVVASLDPRSPIQKPNSAEVAKVNGFSYTVGNYTSFTFDLADDFVVGKDKDICMAIRPLDGTFTPDNSSSYLDLNLAALYFFPKTDGSFLIGGRTYFYKTAKEESGAFRLRGITRGPGVSPNPVTVAESTDYILLAPHNYFVTSKGTSTSGEVTFGGDLDNAASLSDHNFHSEDDIGQRKDTDFSQIESNDLIGGGTDAQGDYLRIGGISGPAFGAMWFNQPLTLGGDAKYCTITPDIYGLGCFFKYGLRAFFTLEYSGSGEGLILALLNGRWNQFGSVGGDFESPELLGYAGDSRLNNSGSFLDTTGTKGLRPPKMGLEFDTKRNWNQTFESKPVDFCSSGSLRQNTRNDPDPSSGTKDFVQYVYWGSDTVNVPCRTTPVNRSSTYDDNRHDPAGAPTADWSKGLSNLINTSPAISADGKTIYIGTNNDEISPTTGRLYAFELDADGYPKSGWETPIFTGTSMTSPVLASDGTIYIGSGTRLYAINPDRSIKFSYNTAGAVTKPTIGADGTIYIAASVPSKFGYIYAIRPDGSLKPGWALNPQAIISPVSAPYVTSPVMSADKTRVYVAARDGYIYAFMASSGAVDWQRQPGTVINASVGVGPDGKVYTGTNDKKVYALNGTNGTIIWTSPFLASEDYASSPVVGPNGTLYIGNYDNRLYAINSTDGSLMWSFDAEGDVQSTPFVDSNNTVYFGCNLRSTDGRRYVFALYSDGTEKWRFDTSPADIRGTPAVKPDGSVYIGGFGSGVFYAINQFALPKSLKNKFITDNSGSVGGVPVVADNSDDWLKGAASKGPWAVRMEVSRSLDANATAPVGYYRYELRTWVRQCNEADCNDVLGSFYDDTRITYYPTLRPPHMEQTINLSSSDQANFDRFLFGFTSQTAAGDNQTSTIRNFKLSFVRSTDATIKCDPNWPGATVCP
jgi:outer membrane protein assembly factor BamB